MVKNNIAKAVLTLLKVILNLLDDLFLLAGTLIMIHAVSKISHLLAYFLCGFGLFVMGSLMVRAKSKL